MEIPEKTVKRWYYELYLKQGLSLATIGKPHHLCRESIRYHFMKYNLPRRKKAYANQYTMSRLRIVSDGTAGDQ